LLQILLLLYHGLAAVAGDELHHALTAHFFTIGPTGLVAEAIGRKIEIAPALFAQSNGLGGIFAVILPLVAYLHPAGLGHMYFAVLHIQHIQLGSCKFNLSKLQIDPQNGYISASAHQQIGLVFEFLPSSGMPVHDNSAWVI